MTITKNQILHISLEILIFLTYSLYMNRKIKAIQTEHENKINMLKSKIDDVNKKCDLLFGLIKENNESNSPPIVIPAQNIGLKKRKKIIENKPYLSSFQTQNTTHFENLQYKQNTEHNTEQLNSKNEIPSKINNQPFDLFSNIINIMDIVTPSTNKNNETKIEIIEDDEKIIDDEIKDELESLLENQDEIEDENQEEIEED
jgi:hypothetical protein